jgi:hypothetical protein
VSKWDMQYTIDQGVVQSDYQDYSAVNSLDKGIHKVEVAMINEQGVSDWKLVVDFIDISGDICVPLIAEEGFETGDFGNLDWKFFGDSSWFVTSSEKKFGIYSAQSGSIGNGETSGLQVTLDCCDGEISFYCKTSSESSFDYLRFYIDGIEQEKWSGQQDWLHVSFSVTEGTRKFEWIYSKDGTISQGSDAAWIDDIVFPVD